MNEWLERTRRRHSETTVALVEAMGATLITLDGRLARAPGLACPVHVPD